MPRSSKASAGAISTPRSEQLKAEYREALYLVYFESMSYREAASVMRKTEQQITSLVYRGKQNLKTILEREGFVYADE